jgi:hypothetical protein
MIALTNRLNERDETIIYLQEELDAYDKIHWETEFIMNSGYSAEWVKQLEDFISMNGLEVPQDENNFESIPNFNNQNAPLKRYAPYTDEM